MAVARLPKWHLQLTCLGSCVRYMVVLGAAAGHQVRFRTANELSPAHSSGTAATEAFSATCRAKTRTSSTYASEHLLHNLRAYQPISPSSSIDEPCRLCGGTPAIAAGIRARPEATPRA